MNSGDNGPIQPATETTLWSGTTSQWVHFLFYLIAIAVGVGCIVAAVYTDRPLIAALAALPVIAIVIRWIATRCLKFEITSQRLRRYSGILNRRIDELELYRVQDTSLEQPLLLRLVGLGNVTIMSSDASSPVVHMSAVKGAFDVREKLRHAVEAERDRKRVRALEMDPAGGENLR
jgi:uncharacterized membrane protein YdbT with pleckstrin-like domain